MTRGAADSAVVEGVAISHPDRVLDPEGVLEFHTWNSRASAVELPDRIVLPTSAAR